MKALLLDSVRGGVHSRARWCAMVRDAVRDGARWCAMVCDGRRSDARSSAMVCDVTRCYAMFTRCHTTSPDIATPRLQPRALRPPRHHHTPTSDRITWAFLRLAGCPPGFTHHHVVGRRASARAPPLRLRLAPRRARHTLLTCLHIHMHRAHRVANPCHLRARVSFTHVPPRVLVRARVRARVAAVLPHARARSHASSVSHHHLSRRRLSRRRRLGVAVSVLVVGDDGAGGPAKGLLGEQSREGHGLAPWSDRL
jgi:hypothetical protein